MARASSSSAPRMPPMMAPRFRLSGGAGGGGAPTRDLAGVGVQLVLELAALPMGWLLKEATSSGQLVVPSQQTSLEALNFGHLLRLHSQVSSNSVRSPNSVASEVQAPSLAVGQAGLLPMTPMLTLLWI